MRKTTKAALAASAGAALLLGGAGSLAFWTDTATVGGGDIDGGTMAITTDSVNTGCGAWTLDSGEAAAGTYNDGDLLVPGDAITRTCNYTIEATGNHLRATLDVSSPSFSGTDDDFDGNLVPSVSDVRINGADATSFTEANDGDTLSADVTVTWTGADTTHQAASTVLDDLTLTASQVHS